MFSIQQAISIEQQVDFFLVGLSVTNSIDPDGNYKTEPEKVVEQAAEQKDVPQLYQWGKWVALK